MTGHKNCGSSHEIVTGKLGKHEQRVSNQDKRLTSSPISRTGINGTRSVITGRRCANLTVSSTKAISSDASSSSPSKHISLPSRRSIHAPPSRSGELASDVDSQVRGKMVLSVTSATETESSKSHLADDSMLSSNRNKKPEHIQSRTSLGLHAVLGNQKVANQSKLQHVQSRRTIPNSRALVGNGNVSNQSKQVNDSTGTIVSKRTGKQALQTQGVGPSSRDTASTSSHRHGHSSQLLSSCGSSSALASSLTESENRSETVDESENRSDIQLNEREMQSINGNTNDNARLAHDIARPSHDNGSNQNANAARLESELTRSSHYSRPLRIQESSNLESVMQNTPPAFSNRLFPLSARRERGSNLVVPRRRIDLGSHSSSVTSQAASNGTSGDNATVHSANGHLSTGSPHRSFLRSRSRLRSSGNTTGSVEGRATNQLSLSGPPPRRPPPPFSPPTSSTPALPNRSTSNSIENAFSLPSPVSSPHRPAGLHSPEFDFLVNDDNNRLNSLIGSSPGYGSRIAQEAHLAVQGLSEVLSSFEHTERNDDSIYEQILMLEASILFGGIGLQDRHSDMRLDVDNMSYEELLALEERIGNVNVGLSEAAIVGCVRKQKYVSRARTVTDTSDVKCSICQEEFEDNVELGVLPCGHSHHPACIKQWLCRKNQCPICKASAC